MDIGLDLTKVGARLKLSEEDFYSEATMLRWVHGLGFKVQVQKKSLYVDGHEREDVVEDRKRFLQVMLDAQKFLVVNDEHTLEDMSPPTATHDYVNQDEKIFHSNDVQQRYISHITPHESKGSLSEN